MLSEGLPGTFSPDVEPVIVTTLLEHHSNELPWRYLPGVTHVRLEEVDAEGFIDLDKLEETLRAYNQEQRYGRKRVVLVAVSGASNVIGTCNDLAAISRIVHRYGARLHVDAAQLVAHRPVDMAREALIRWPFPRTSSMPPLAAAR